MLNIAQLEVLPVTVKQVKAAMHKDLVLSKVLHWVQRGWPDHIPEGMKSYALHRDELTVESNCLLWRICVVILENL